MINEAESLVDSYYKWLQKKTLFEKMDDCIEITTPYIDRHNDYIQIYVKKSGNSFVLTDNGYTMGDLSMSGLKLDSPKRKELIRITLNGFGIDVRDMKNGSRELYIESSIDDFPLKKHNLIQAVLAVNDMFYAASAHVASLFLEDVRDWLDSNSVKYEENAAFSGKSGLERRFDFVIPKSEKSPERLIKSLNNLDKNSTNSSIMDWIDIKEMRPESKAFVLVNDIQNKQTCFNAFSKYDMEAVLWSKKEEIIEELAA